MASIKKVKTSTIFTNHKLNNFHRDNPDNLENIMGKDENENNYNNDNWIKKSFLEELLKCEICNNIFDLNIHIPVVVKCGHTFCKKCILDYNSKINKKNKSCPLDKVKDALNIESCVINLRVELIIRNIFQKSTKKKTNNIYKA